MAAPHVTTVARGRFHLTPSMPDIVKHPAWLYCRGADYLLVCHKDIPSISDRGMYRYPYAISIFGYPSQRLAAFITLETSKDMTNAFCLFDWGKNEDDEDIVRHINFNAEIDKTLSGEAVWDVFQKNASLILEPQYGFSQLDWHPAN